MLAEQPALVRILEGMALSARSDRDAGGRAWRGRVGGCGELGFDEADGVAHGREARRDTVGNLDVEPLLARHEDLDGVEAVGAQVLGQPGIVGDPRFIGSEVKGEDIPHGRRYVSHQTLLREAPTQVIRNRRAARSRRAMRVQGMWRMPARRDVSATRPSRTAADRQRDRVQFIVLQTMPERTQPCVVIASWPTEISIEYFSPRFSSKASPASRTGSRGCSVMTSLSPTASPLPGSLIQVLTAQNRSPHASIAMRKPPSVRDQAPVMLAPLTAPASAPAPRTPLVVKTIVAARTRRVCIRHLEAMACA